MPSTTRVTLPRLALVFSAFTAAGFIACSDAPTGVQSNGSLSASADRGGGKAQQGNQNQNENQNENENEHENKNQQQDNNNNNQNAGRVELRIQLVTPATAAPDTDAEGQARFEMRDNRTRLRIEGEHLTVGDTVNFLVGGAQVGSGVVGALGEVEFELDTQDGDTVPAVAAGTTVAIQTTGGATILSGSF